MDEEQKVSQRYRELGREEPPRHLDEAILAASRRAADVRPAPLVPPTGRRRWYFPVAAAAIIVLAVAVTVHVERERPDAESAVLMQTPAQEAAKEQKQAPEPRADSARRQKSEARPAAPAPAAPAPKPEPAPMEKAFAPDPPRASAPPSLAAKPTPDAGAAAQERRRAEMARDQADVAASRAERPAREPPPLGGAARGMRSGEEPPEKWLERIAELRKAGKHDEADKALDEFRKRYPGYKLPEAVLRK